MSLFIEKNDYPQSIRTEILNALTRDDDAVLDIIEDRNITLMKGYLEGRYDAEAIFAGRGSERNRLVVSILLDLVVYDVFSIHNPQKLSAVRKDRYDRAIEWLKAAQKGNIVINGAPRPANEKSGSDFLMASNAKRDYSL